MDSDRETIGASTGDRRRVLRTLGRILGVLLAVAVVGGTLVLCAGAFLVGVLADDTGYSEPRTAVDWMQAIDRATSALMFAAGALAVALVVTCLIAVAGALFFALAVPRRPAKLSATRDRPRRATDLGEVAA